MITDKSFWTPSNIIAINLVITSLIVLFCTGRITKLERALNRMTRYNYLYNKASQCEFSSDAD